MDSKLNSVDLSSIFIYQRDYGILTGTPTIRIDTKVDNLKTTYRWVDVLDIVINYLTDMDIHLLLFNGLYGQPFTVWLIQTLRSSNMDLFMEVSTNTKIQPNDGLKRTVDAWDVVIDDMNSPHSVLPYIHLNNVYYRFMINNIDDIPKIEDFIRFGVHRWKILVYVDNITKQVYDYCLRKGLRLMQRPHYNFGVMTY